MAGKEALMFLVDCAASMVPRMGMAKEAVRSIMTQKMLQNKQNEFSVVMFGLPALETSNSLNEKFPDAYLGIKELSGLERGSVELLRSLNSINTMEGGTSDLLDAMIVGMTMVHERTAKKKYSKHVYLVTDASSQQDGLESLEEVKDSYVDSGCKLHFVSFGNKGLLSAPMKGEKMSIKDENDMMLSSLSAITQGIVVEASSVVELLGATAVKKVNPMLSKIDLSIGTKLTIHCRLFKKCQKTSTESLSKEVMSGGEGNLHKGGGVNAPGVGKVRVDRVYRDPEMPEVEVLYEDRVKGYRYGQ
ncbi:unnamed protein product, partial [Choristocarpus tenellus]